MYYCHNEKIGPKSVPTSDERGSVSVGSLRSADAPEGGFILAVSESRLCFLFWKKNHKFFPKRKEEEKKTFHFFSITPLAPSPLSSSPGLVSKGEREKEKVMLSTRVAASLPLILPLSFRAATFMHETEKKIESIQRPFRQWRKDILRALLDMKIDNKNQFLASLCSLNDNASTHSAIVSPESNSAAPARDKSATYFLTCDCRF